MTFIVIVNGTEFGFKILHGKSVILTYESIAWMAGACESDKPTITYRFGEVRGTLSPGKRVEVPLHQKPIFNVEDVDGKNEERVDV